MNSSHNMPSICLGDAVLGGNCRAGRLDTLALFEIGHVYGLVPSALSLSSTSYNNK
jgi:hypothetical protein